MTSKRSISATNETATLAQVIKPVLYARLDFSSGIQRLHTEIGPKTATHPIHGAEAYTGIGDFGGISSEVVESIIGAPQSLRISLTGVKSAFISDAMVDDYYRRDAEVMIGLEDGNGDSIDDPEILFSGFMDKVDISLTQGLAQMTLVCESRGTNLLRTPEQRYTDEDKQREVTGDLGGEYIFRMLDLSLLWGQTPVQGGVLGQPDDGPGTTRVK